MTDNTVSKNFLSVLMVNDLSPHSVKEVSKQ